MSYTDDEKKDLLRTVEMLMKKAGISIRDTWNGFEGENLDDGISNNGQSGGIRLFDIIEKKAGKAEVNGHWLYPIEGFKSIAYENYKLYIPEKYKDKMHPIIHETVHFLQHMTLDEDKNYIPLKSESIEDYKIYVNQRCEQEAHFVQLLYIEANELDIKDEETNNKFKILLKEALNDKTKRTNLIIYAKEKGIL